MEERDRTPKIIERSRRRGACVQKPGGKSGPVERIRPQPLLDTDTDSPAFTGDYAGAEERRGQTPPHHGEKV